MTGRLPFNIDIPRRGPCCSKGGEAFHPGTEYHSILLEISHDLYKRQDFCSACWDKYNNNDDSLSQIKSHWKAQIIVSAKQNDKGLLDKQNYMENNQVLEILREGLSSDKTEDQAEAFILALYLARKKVLILREQLEKENEIIFLYEIAATEEMLPIRKVSLSELQTAAIQKRLASKLSKKPS